MKKFLIAIVIIAAAVVMEYGIKYINSPLNAVIAERMTHEAIISAKGLIARNEKVYYAPLEGTLYHNADEGEKVSTDAHIATIYASAPDEETLNELKAMDRRIDSVRDKMRRRSLSAMDSADAENGIKSRMDDIYDKTRINDITAIGRYKDEINRLRAGQTVSDDDELEGLEEVKNGIELGISEGKQDIYTEISGMFTSYIDGLEGVLSPDRIREYTPSYINNLNTDTGREHDSGSYVNVGDDIGKVVNDRVWYIIAVVDKTRADRFREDKNVNIRMKNMADAEVKATVEYVSEGDANGQAVMLLKSTNYLESALSYRKADIDIIFERNTGYKVPLHAIRNADGKKYVIGASGINHYRCECEVLYSDIDEEIALVESTEDADYKLSNMDRIIIGER